MNTCKECKGYFKNAHELCYAAETEQVDGNTIACDGFVKAYDEFDDCPSATNGDYSPSNPWDAPGMSIKDFL